MSTKFKATETISFENFKGEMLVSYTWEKENAKTTNVELKSVELVIAGKGIPFTYALSHKQQQAILDQLSYEPENE